MLFPDLLHISRYIKQVYAIDVEIYQNGVYHCNAVKLTKQKEMIDFAVLQTNDDFLELIQTKIPKEQAVCLVLNGKGIIHRKLTVNASLSDSEIIKTVIPNVNPDDFYLQQYIVSHQKDKQERLVSLVRRSVVDKLIMDFSEVFDFIVNISIGPFVLDDILPVIPNENSLCYKNLEITIREQKIDDFNVSENSKLQILKVGDSSVSSELIPAFALGFSFLINYKNINTSVSLIQEISKEYIYKQKFQFIGKASLLVMFCLLLLNFLVFDHFYKKMQLKDQNLVNQEEMIDKLRQLKQTFELKNQFLQEAGLLEKNKVSFYLDRLAVTIPNDIILTNVQVNPISNPLKKDDYNFTNKLIRVSGISNNSSSFNKWVKEMKNSLMFENISIISYEYDNQTNAALFTVDITIL